MEKNIEEAAKKRTPGYIWRLATKEDLKEEIEENIAIIYNNYADYFIRTGSYSEAEKYFEMSLEGIWNLMRDVIWPYSTFRDSD